MAKKLSELTPAGALADTDLMLVSVGGATPQSRKATLAQVRGTPEVTLVDETTELGSYHTLKFLGTSVTVTEEAPGIAVVTVYSGGGGAGVQIMDLTINGKPGVPGNYTTLMRFPVPTPMTIPANFAGSQAYAEVPATVETELYMYKNGAWIGTLTFAVGAQVGVFTANPIDTIFSFSTADIFKFETDYTQDATLADLGIAFLFNY